ncbi:MAG: hypothetical protein DRO88_05780 [Promethearchaeia archaeon]|nr:MAG: hypothetical protein DRO88_05780 [Candidatus Lokiarchaeia archaeon]
MICILSLRDNTMLKIAFPSSIQGLHAELTKHFGHTPAFTIITYNPEKEQVESVEIIQNAPHQQGECMSQVLMLKNLNVTDIVVLRIGNKVKAGLLQANIRLYLGTFGTVKENFNAFKDGNLQLLFEPVGGYL